MSEEHAVEEAASVVSNEERMRRLDAAVAKAAAAEQKELSIDFDEALEEYRRQNKPLRVTFLGEQYELPRTTPANFAMFYIAYCLQRDGDQWRFEVPEDKFREFLELMFGPRFSTRVAESDVEIGFVLRQIVPRILVAWGLKFLSLAEDDTGKVTAVEMPDS